MNRAAAHLAAYLDTLWFHRVMQDNLWIIAAVQTVHILCIAIVFSGALILALRSFSLVGTDWSLGQWARRLDGWSAWALGLLLASGVTLVISEPQRSLTNPVFQLKMLMILTAVLLASWLSGRVRAEAASPGPPPLGRILALVVLALWVGVISAGRWIAYYLH